MADYLRVSKTRIKWNRKAFAEVRTSPETNAALQGIVDDLLAEVGTEGYAGGVNPGRSRSRGYVVTTSWRTIRHEARDHTLLRALAARAGKWGAS